MYESLFVEKKIGNSLKLLLLCRLAWSQHETEVKGVHSDNEAEFSKATKRFKEDIDSSKTSSAYNLQASGPVKRMSHGLLNKGRAMVS